MEKFKLFCKCTLLVPVMIGGLLLSWLFIPMIFNPMRRPAPMIRNHVLRITPIGTSMEEVIVIVRKNERWGMPSVNRENGFLHSMIDATGRSTIERTEGYIVGSKRIQTSPERYSIWGLMERNTRIFWGFDEEGKLIEVNVRSTFATALS